MIFEPFLFLIKFCLDFRRKFKQQQTLEHD